MPGRSILITSAPRSPRSMVQNGPARTRERSRMRKPARGWGIKHYLSAFFFLPLPERERVRVRVDLGHSSTVGILTLYLQACSLAMVTPFWQLLLLPKAESP